MLQHINKPTKRIPNVESTDSPGLTHGAIFNGYIFRLYPSQRRFQIINFDGKGWHRCTGTPSEAMLIWTFIFELPPSVLTQP
jgi:hypothetical protein